MDIATTVDGSNIGFKVDSDSEEITFTNEMVFRYVYVDKYKLYSCLSLPLYAKTVSELAKDIARHYI